MNRCFPPSVPLISYQQLRHDNRFICLTKKIFYYWKHCNWKLKEEKKQLKEYIFKKPPNLRTFISVQQS